MAFINRLVILCCFFRYTLLLSNALIQSTPQQFKRRSCTVTPTSSTLLNAFYSNNNKKTQQPQTNNINGNSDLFKTLELKDEALMQAQTAVSSLENALESAVTNLENMQQLLQNQVLELEEELETTKLELSSTQSELDLTRSELERSQEELVQSREETNQLELALAESQLQASRVDELESLVNELKNNGNGNGNAFSVAQNLTPVKKDASDKDKPWQIFTTNQKVIPVLNEWIQIKGTNEGEIQISGKVTNHPTIPDGDAIVTSPLVDGGKNAGERKIVTTLSGSKYRLGTAMTMPASDSKSQKITSNKKKKLPGQQLTKVRSSITIPDLSGNTLGNG